MSFEGDTQYDVLLRIERLLERVAELVERRSVDSLQKCDHRHTLEASPGRVFQCPDCFATWKWGEAPP